MCNKMKLTIIYSNILTLLVLTGVRTQVCNKLNSIDISKGSRLTNGDITFKGITYNKNEYFIDDKTNTERGCICMKKTCARKCCPFGYGVNTMRLCEKVADKFDPPVWDQNRTGIIEGANATNMFYFIIDINCQKSIRVQAGESNTDYHLRDDGTLYVTAPNDNPPWHVEDINQYCIDTFIMADSVGDQTTKLDAFLCFPKKQDDRSHYVVSSSCMLISCVFILMTVAVYAWLPELRNLHGKVLMAYLLCFFVGFLFMSTMQILLYKDEIPEVCCLIFTFIIYFALESAFFWLNVMCFDIWWTFSGKRGLSLAKLSSQARFLAYAMYAFGIPTALTILLASLEFSGLPSDHSLLPKIRDQGCFLYGHSRLIYLYGPILILIVANILFFILTAVKIAQIKKQTSMLKSKESSTHSGSKDKQRLILYLKLFAVMGINWILEVISALYPKAQSIWIYTDAFNVLIGVTVFVVFVCKPKMFRLIKKRYKQVRCDPMSRTVTSISARTMSIKEDMQMTSVKSK